MEAKAEVVLAARTLGKTFGGQRGVLVDHFTLRRGEIHGLVGENGSGKSTFIKLLSGYHTPDAGGSLEIDGTPVALPVSGGADGASFPLRFVHQDLGLCDTATVLENFSLRQWETRAGWRISWRAERKRARTALARFDLDVSLDAEVRTLSGLDRAVLAIVRAVDPLLEARRGVLVLDEPTATLDLESTRRLLDLLRRLADNGIAILLVSHRLDEITAVTDRVTVLRDGEIVDTLPTNEMTHDSLAEALIGFRLESLYPTRDHSPDRTGVGLAVRGLVLQGGAQVDLDVASGEIVGLTGLAGSGFEEIPYYIFGARRAKAGTIFVGESELNVAATSPKRAIEGGLAFVPASRARYSGAVIATARENMTLPHVALRNALRPGLASAERRTVVEMMREFDVRPPEPDREFASFSGGNQQKALLAKWFRMDPDVLLLHEPTEGVDVGAKREIFRLMRSATSRGMAVLIASVEYEDLAHLCDRVIVFHRDGSTRELGGSELSYELVVHEAMVGGFEQVER